MLWDVFRLAPNALQFDYQYFTLCTYFYVSLKAGSTCICTHGTDCVLASA
jgi:hypothetical protein